MNFSKKILKFFSELGFDFLFIILKIFILIIIFFIFYFIANKTRKIIRKSDFLNKIPKEVITFLSDFIFYIILIIGFLTGLSLIGIETTAIWASLGLGSFALGFALKDIISNFISGLIIIFTKTYQINDEITINDITGKVKSINLRYTVLIPVTQNEENENQKNIILVPNNIIFSNISKIKKFN